VTKPIGVAVIGANPDHGWAASTHIPVLKALPEYELLALSTSRAESATAASARFDVDAFHEHRKLLAVPGVELVVVSVKAPSHRELVLAALDAGKHVYCEWPLGNGIEETIELADAGRRSGQIAVIGLQARMSPVINRVRDLVADGFVGTVLSSSIIATSWVYGGTVDTWNAYQLDKDNGVTMLTIQTGHLLDAVSYCIGEFDTLQATMATVRPRVQVVQTGEVIETDTPDQIALSGILENGAVASMHLRGGLSRGTNLLWEIVGTEGELQVHGPGAHVSSDDAGTPTLFGGRGQEPTLAPLVIPGEYRWASVDVPDGPQFNVAQYYTRLASDIRNGTHLVPTFEHALRRHRLVDTIQRAATTGERQRYARTD
jgi:predicted dehydrogenase